ncbi:MAG: archaellin/type IV pilin N-terminal domain-containing protein [Conexivisphaerales archaeon]
MTTYITRKRKAVSPVIATVILIAVAVALGIAVAFWASGLTSSFSKYEKLGVNTQYATIGPLTGSSCLHSASTCWTVNLGGQNTGSSDATITQIQVNGVPLTINATQVYWCNASGCTPTGATSSTLSVPSGASFTIKFELDNINLLPSKTFTSGQTIQVTIITAAGNNYPASIVLP